MFEKEVNAALALEKEMRDAGMEIELHTYPRVPHWFMEDDRPEYDADAAEKAWERTVAFLSKLK